jgi:GST-like protein
MIDFYMADTPNVKKVTLMLEECGLSYASHQLDLQKLEQKKPDFLEINPNGRVPAIVDHEGPYGSKLSVFESGAILYYLAEKTGKFMGNTLTEKTKVMEWVMFQMSAIGPNIGNYHFGSKMEPKNLAYVERFDKETRRIIGVMNTQLNKYTYLAGDFYSIADMCSYFWMKGGLQMHSEWFETAPSVRRWLETVGERPAVSKIP